jgi:hypothetical protein
LGVEVGFLSEVSFGVFAFLFGLRGREKRRRKEEARRGGGWSCSRLGVSRFRPLIFVRL